MNKLLSTLLLVLLALNVSAQQTSKPRVLISTDIGCTDPDSACITLDIRKQQCFGIFTI